jgi:hypothetical protein
MKSNTHTQKNNFSLLNAFSFSFPPAGGDAVLNIHCLLMYDAA